jgi:hypothetical protein
LPCFLSGKPHTLSPGALHNSSNAGRSALWRCSAGTAWQALLQ